ASPVLPPRRLHVLQITFFSAVLDSSWKLAENLIQSFPAHVRGPTWPHHVLCTLCFSWLRPVLFHPAINKPHICSSRKKPSRDISLLNTPSLILVLSQPDLPSSSSAAHTFPGA